MSKDAKFFSTTKKGEIHELKEELDSPKEDRKRDALKKVIAAMTVGKDVSMLFAEVVKCMNTQDLELKKLVYLYIMNYAKSQPELAILAVNTFVKDATCPNPLLRALAVRTMGCIRVDKITEYLCEPLHKCLKDQDPYVRKTAAVCVAKLYDINPEMVADRGFLDQLLDLLSDSNPMVVANAVAALTEIEESSKSGIFKLHSDNLQKLSAALNECTEWGQVFILNALANYHPRDARQAENICDKVTPRLNHANSAVVLGAVKVLMKFMDFLETNEMKNLMKKMAPPLITLLSKEPEIQYVALKNINLIVQKRPQILAYDIKAFFCKYNDPIYVKMEKLEILIMLASERNIDQVLLEFKEYATEVDVEFVRKSVRAIGRCAIKLEKAAERCIHVLLELIQTKLNYVVQEAIIVIKDIFRKYPNQYESIIATLCENLQSLDDPEAKAAMIWIVGEYAGRIDNADELLDRFLESFHDENSQVQLQLLTATVKLFLKKPKTTQHMVQRVLEMATKETDNPDLRDRGFIYWRLLSTDPEAAKAIVLPEKPLISDDSSQLDPALLEELLSEISTLASVFHKPAETFVSKAKRQKVKVFKPKTTEAVPEEEQDLTGNRPAVQPSNVPNLLDLGDLGVSLPTAAPINPLGDLFGAPSAPVVPNKPVLLPAERGKGLQISGGVIRRGNDVIYDLVFHNQSPTTIAQFAIQLNHNSFGLAPANQILDLPPLSPGQSAPTTVHLVHNGTPTAGTPSSAIQVAIKHGADISYFKDSIPLHVVFSSDGRLEKGAYVQMWKSISDQNERISEANRVLGDVDQIVDRLEAKNMFAIARRKVAEKVVLYLSVKLWNGVILLVELTFESASTVRVCCKTNNLEWVPLLEETVQHFLQSTA